MVLAHVHLHENPLGYCYNDQLHVQIELLIWNLEQVVSSSTNKQAYKQCYACTMSNYSVIGRIGGTLGAKIYAGGQSN